MRLDPNINRKGSIIKENITSDLHKHNEFPLFSLFEVNITGMCNRTCVFCPRINRDLFPNKNEYMSMELYRKLMAELQSLKYDGIIAYSGFSEPLFHKDINDMISTARDRCPQARTELYTNGDMLNAEKLSKLFDSGLSSVHISLYDGPEQTDLFIAMRDIAGIDPERFILRERFLTNEEGYGLTISNRAGMVDFNRLGMQRLDEPMKSECYYPFYMMFVDYTGEIIVCSHDWGKKLIIGNANTDSIIDVWMGNVINAVREKLSRKDRNFKPCKECDVKGTLMGKDHFERWKKHYNSISIKERSKE